MAKHESFLVRVWWRARSGEGQWVGRLEHLQDRAVQNFHDPEALLAYLRKVLIPVDGAKQESDEPVFPVSEHSKDIEEAGLGDPAYTLVSPKAISKDEEVQSPTHALAETAHNSQ